MKMQDIWILAIHAVFYTVWFFDSRTIESWRNKRRFWKSAAAVAAGPRPRVDISAEVHEYAHKRMQERAEAMRRHPAGSKLSGQHSVSLNVDYETISRIIREHLEEEKQRREDMYKYNPLWFNVNKNWKDKN